MAIAKIKKFEIIGLQKDKGKLLSLLQQMGKVQLINIREDTLDREIPEIKDAEILEIEEEVAFLSSFQEECSFFAGMAPSRPPVYHQQLKDIIAKFDYLKVLKELSELRNHLKNLSQHKEKLLQERHLLLPWRKLSIPLSQTHCAACGILLGILPAEDYEKIKEESKKENIAYFCEIINQDKANIYLVFLYIREQFVRLETILKNSHFNFVTLSHHEGTVKDRLLEINRETVVLDDQIEEAKEKISKLSENRFKLMVVYDYFFNIKKIQEASENLAKQQFTFALSGWVKARDIESLSRAVSDKFQDTAIFISEAQGEEPPVDLQNPPLVQPFEFITKIYGFPKYNEIDPTPYLAPFFFIYFGFCVSDAGYGFILSLFSFFVLKKFRMGPQGLRFFRLFFLCGISTIIIGAITGSWFGNLFDLLAQGSAMFLPLKNFKDSLIILDPMKEPTRLLGIALSFGIIQVWFGNIVAIIGNIKNKRYPDIFLDQVSMLMLLFGLTGMALIFLKLIGGSQAILFKSAAGLGALVLLLTQGRAEKGVGAKLFYGAYNLYNTLSGYLSDILSYSRLWALGLVTGVMASTINLISVQFSQIFSSFIPFANKVAFIKILASSIIIIVIFICGHSVSFLMNLLGAFVHPVRLQFVEFFSKFFKSGGIAFKPFKVESKYVSIE